MSLFAQFMFHHHDLCRFHQMFYAEAARIEHAQEEQYQWFRENAPDSSADELALVQASRFRESLRAQDLELESTRSFADQLLVIGLWATVEQFGGLTLIECERSVQGEAKASPPSEWRSLRQRFAALPIDFETLKSYADVDECRVLNNKLKHVGVVDDQLAQYSSFSDALGQTLGKATFELQRYTDAVFEFIGHILESADRVCSPASWETRR